MTQQAKYTPPPFPDLARSQLEELCLRQNQRVTELLAALKRIRQMAGGLIDGELSAAVILAKCFAEAGEAMTKAEGR